MEAAELWMDLTPEVAFPWIEGGVTPNDAKAWITLGYDPVEASALD